MKASKGQILRSGEILESKDSICSLEGAWMSRPEALNSKLQPWGNTRGSEGPSAPQAALGHSRRLCVQARVPLGATPVLWSWEDLRWWLLPGSPMPPSTTKAREGQGHREATVRPEPGQEQFLRPKRERTPMLSAVHLLALSSFPLSSWIL